MPNPKHVPHSDAGSNIQNPKSPRPKQSLGQNFLSDPNTARKIVDALRAPEDAHVVEIGPGTGALTGELLARYEHVTALEVDERLVEVLRAEYPEVDVRHVDVLEVDWAALAAEHEGPLYVIGNLPYNITSPILFALLDARRHLAEAVLMMQLEVAQRIVADCGNKRYGIPSVLVQLQAQPELLFRVSRNVFYPKPNVTSAVLRLTFDEEADRTRDQDVEWLREVVRTAFGQRRKMLRNSLSAYAKEHGVTLPNEWGRRRPESLPPEAFVELAQFLAKVER